MSIFLPVPLAAVYGFMAWRLLRTPGPALPAGLAWLLPAALVAHGLLLFHSVLGAGDLRLGFASALSVVAWLAAVATWTASRKAPLPCVQGWASVLAALALLGMSALDNAHPVPNSDRLALRLHLVVAFLAYGLLAVAAFLVVLMTALEKRLHRKPHGDTRLDAGLPPLLTLEALLFRTLGAGFVLLTLTVASGVLFSEELFGQPLEFTHKVVLALLSWAVFGGLLLGRRLRGWRGRTALIWTITGYTLLILAYLGTRFVLEYLLPA